MVKGSHGVVRVISRLVLTVLWRWLFAVENLSEGAGVCGTWGGCYIVRACLVVVVCVFASPTRGHNNALQMSVLSIIVTR